MKIYTKVVFNWNPETEQYEETYAETYDYNGEVALCQYRETEVPVYTTAYDRFMDYLSRVVPEMTDQVRRSREFDETMVLENRRTDIEATNAKREYDLTQLQLNYNIDTDAMEEIDEMPVHLRASAYQNLKTEMLTTEGENLRFTKFKAAQTQGTEHTDLMRYLKPPEEGMLDWLSAGEGPPDLIQLFNERVAFYNEGQAKAIALGRPNIAEGIKHTGEAYKAQASMDMMMQSANSMITFFEDKGALGTDMANTYRMILKQGGVTAITPQLTSLLDSELVTFDEATKLLTDITGVGVSLQKAYYDAGEEPPEWLNNNIETWMGGLQQPAAKALQVLQGDAKNGEEIRTGIQKGASMSIKDINDAIAAAKTQQGKDASVSDDEIAAFVAENNIKVLDEIEKGPRISVQNPGPIKASFGSVFLETGGVGGTFVVLKDNSDKEFAAIPWNRFKLAIANRPYVRRNLAKMIGSGQGLYGKTSITEEQVNELVNLFISP